jgi:glycosyltransferase involved in cell wall biosynthesis
MPSVAREELHSQYKDADMLFLHLNNYDAFLKVLPSKIFEYAATGKPILAGVSGYAADFLRNEVPGVEVFKPCDAGGMIAAFSKLEASPKMFDRREFIKKYARSTIMKDMAIDILDTFPSKK